MVHMTPPELDALIERCKRASSPIDDDMLLDDCAAALSGLMGMRSALIHLTQAYLNRHSPQHRRSALVSAESVIETWGK